MIRRLLILDVQQALPVKESSLRNQKGMATLRGAGSILSFSL